ncbi:MAG TPA: hypothetical protein VMF05_12620 [Stellaceae bacterium]|nr:hypothetical protein [Stellaceae bacterium]
MPFDCFAAMRRIARQLHHRRRFAPHHGRFHRGLWRVARRVRHRVWPHVAAPPRLMLATKACVATGIVGIGAAGIVAGALAIGPAGSITPDPSLTAAVLADAGEAGAGGAGAGGGIAGPAASRAPAAGIGVSDPSLSFDLDGPDSPPAFSTIPDDPVPPVPFSPAGPGGPDDPPDPHAPSVPPNPPARVPEPSSAAILGVALLGLLLCDRAVAAGCHSPVQSSAAVAVRPGRGAAARRSRSLIARPRP